MPDTETGRARHHHLTLFYRSWRIWSSLCLKRNRYWTPHGRTLHGLDRNLSIHGLSPTTPQSCVHINRWVHSLFELPESRSSHLWNVTCLLSHLTHSTFPLPRLIQHMILYTLLHTSSTISIRLIPASTQTTSVETVRFTLKHLNTAFHWTKTISILRNSLALMESAQIGGPYRRTNTAMSTNSLCLHLLSPLGLIWANLHSWWSSQPWLLSAWHGPWKSAFYQTSAPDISGLYRALSTLPLHLKIWLMFIK